MKVCVISDDLTGASDCGGQLVRYGLDVSVVMQRQNRDWKGKEAIIFNTDSRSVPEKEAYKRVKKVSEWVKNESYDMVYKKIDSTMRGNIGQEINAIYDTFQPDFVFIAPAFPEAGRQVIHGVHFLNQKQLHETEVANDPKTPVKDSLITRIIKDQSGREVGHLSYKDLHKGYETVSKKLVAFKKQNISYITVDSVHESDLQCLVDIVRSTEFSVIFSGSTGLINYLPQTYGLKQSKKGIELQKNEKPVLFVIGSVSKIGRIQLNQLLINSDTVGLEVDPEKLLLGSISKQNEANRVIKEAIKSLRKEKSIALFSSNKVKETQKVGARQGYSPVEISNYISMTLGEIAVHLINYYDINNLFLTGGDTAQQVLGQLGVSEFHLLDEVESGIPLGKLEHTREIFAVTKAGSFGTNLAMIKSKCRLQGRKYKEDCSEQPVSLIK
ncbi:four-carbon acid sugar kinase family protein [Bacillus safensis]|uniref:four-carbon acid sugar kinase family protein n=1 Tax=Bacillus safensis TaxID=561879 RepID=UPI00382D9848